MFLRMVCVAWFTTQLNMHVWTVRGFKCSLYIIFPGPEITCVFDMLESLLIHQTLSSDHSLESSFKMIRMRGYSVGFMKKFWEKKIYVIYAGLSDALYFPSFTINSHYFVMWRVRMEIGVEPMISRVCMSWSPQVFTQLSVVWCTYKWWCFSGFQIGMCNIYIFDKKCYISSPNPIELPLINIVLIDDSNEWSLDRVWWRDKDMRIVNKHVIWSPFFYAFPCQSSASDGA